MARRFEELVAADARFELAAPRTVNLVCFRARHPSGDPDRADRLNRDLLAAVNNSGRAYLSHTVIPGPAGRPAHTLRMAIGAPATQPGHIEEAWDLIRLHAARLLGSGS